VTSRDAQLRVRAMGRLSNGPEDDALLGPGCELGFRPRGFKRHDEVSRARVRAHDGRARRVQRSVHAFRVARAAAERDLVCVPRMQRERAGPRRDRRSISPRLAHGIVHLNASHVCHRRSRISRDRAITYSVGRAGLPREGESDSTRTRYVYVYV